MNQAKDPDILLRSVSGGVSPEPKLPPEASRQIGQVLLLVHGYNVSAAEASKTLADFRTALAGFHPDMMEKTFSVTWEGNWSIPGLRPAAYPFMLKNALESAETFYKALHALYDPAKKPSGPDHVVIVAHSLGCRLTAEMLKLVRQRGRPDELKRLTIILMAAAIPTEHLLPAAPLQDALGAADQTVLLHSDADSVLSTWFRIGQTLGGEGWFPYAVGAEGQPEKAGWTHSFRMAAFNHSDYWAETETILCLSEVLERRIKSFSVARPLASRQALAARDLGGSPLATSLLPIW